MRGRQDSALGLFQMHGQSSEITQVASILWHLKDLTCYIYFADGFFDLLLFLVCGVFLMRFSRNISLLNQVIKKITFPSWSSLWFFCLRKLGHTTIISHVRDHWTVSAESKAVFTKWTLSLPIFKMLNKQWGSVTGGWIKVCLVNISQTERKTWLNFRVCGFCLFVFLNYPLFVWLYLEPRFRPYGVLVHMRSEVSCQLY